MINPFGQIETKFAGVGKVFTAAKDSTTNHDLLVPVRKLVNGGTIYFDKCTVGDTFTCQILGTDQITVLNEWITDWPAIPNNKIELVTEQVADLSDGVYLRIKYTSVGTIDDVKILIGYRLYSVVE